MNPVEVIRGTSPVILGQPHGGTYVPEKLFNRLNGRGKGLADTDWHITRLYDDLQADLTIVKATFHRYVIDANRDPNGKSLYPGQNTTSFCPLTDFDGHTIWHAGEEPSAPECEERRVAFHKPYHEAVAAEIERIKAIHGFAILYDCHSIRSHIPFLFEGILPVFSIGTNSGASCAIAIEAAVVTICKQADGYDCVVNGRFKGGWTTRHYGQPDNGVHAIQMELAQRAYMDEAAPWSYRADLAARLRPYLTRILTALTHELQEKPYE
ncbi:MAG: N-formylglutamate deformylase [Hyphomicrobiales bacterium]